MSGPGWYGRPVAAASLAVAAVAASAFVLSGAEYGPRESAALSAYSATIRHRGVDAREMERSVAVPLEDAMASIPGVVELYSQCEYGMARVSARFAAGLGGEPAYESIRHAAQRVYEALPPTAQRPELASTSEGRGPAWVAAVASAREGGASIASLVERAVKPALESLPGSGGVELAGSGLPEIRVEVDDMAASLVGLSPADVARALAGSDALFPAGSILIGGVESTMVADGRLERPEELLALPVPSPSGRPVPLGAIAEVELVERAPEILSRVDGERALTIAVMPGGEANLPALSRAIARETGILAQTHGLEFRVLSDAGAELAASFRSILGAAAQGALAVALASALLAGGSRRARLVAVAMVPATLAIAAAALSAHGFSLDRHAMAGLAVGLGASVDAGLLTVERLARAGTPSDGRAAMRGLAPSLASGTATTLAVLSPLSRLDFVSEGVAAVAAAIGSASIASYALAVVVMPPLVLGSRGTGLRGGIRPGRPARSGRWAACGDGLAAARARAARAARRLLAANARLCAKRPRSVLAAALGLSLAGAMGLWLSPLDERGPSGENSVYAHLEFEAGADAAEVDARLAAYSKALAMVPGVLRVRSTARRGSGSALVVFDPGAVSRTAVADACRRSVVGGGFAWIPEPSPDERVWELTVSGDDDAECRRVAEEAARAVASLPFVADVALLFKDGPADLRFRPDRQRAAALGLSHAAAADALRRGVHGPVAYKRLGDGGEVDVRVAAARASGLPTLEEALALSVGAGRARVDSFMEAARMADVSRIDRRDRRRIASIAMRCGPVDPRKARKAAIEAVAGVRRPAGYSIEFDRRAVEAAERLAGVGLSFAAAAALAFMATALITESLGAPAAVMSSLPPSLAVPALLIAAAGIPINASIACAFVAVSGMAVNASILTVDRLRADAARSRPSGRVGAACLYRAIRARAAALAATCGTGVAGALPFLFLSGPGDAVARALGFVAAAGTVASFVVALTAVPALAAAAPRLFSGSGPGGRA